MHHHHNHLMFQAQFAMLQQTCAQLFDANKMPTYVSYSLFWFRITTEANVLQSMRRQRARQRAEEDEMRASLLEQQARLNRMERQIEQINTVVEKRERRKEQAAKRRAKAKERQWSMDPFLRFQVMTTDSALVFVRFEVNIYRSYIRISVVSSFLVDEPVTCLSCNILCGLDRTRNTAHRSGTWSSPFKVSLFLCWLFQSQINSIAYTTCGVFELRKNLLAQTKIKCMKWFSARIYEHILWRAFSVWLTSVVSIWIYCWNLRSINKHMRFMAGLCILTSNTLSRAPGL